MEFLLTIIVVFFLLGWVLRRLLPWLLLWWVNKKMGVKPEPKKKTKEGEVFVSKNVKQEKIVNEDEGEYVDYEEIKN